MTTIVSLNEFTAPVFLALVLAGRRPALLRVDPMLPPARGPLERLARWAKQSGRATALIDDHPELADAWAYPQILFRQDPFARTEAWQRAHYGFAGPAGKDARYGMAFKLVATMALYWRYTEAFLLEAAWRKAGGRGFRVIGLTPDTLGFIRAFFGVQALAGVRPMVTLAPLVNLAIALIATAAGAVHVLRRLRPGHRPKEPFLCADYLPDPRNFLLYEELKDGGDIVLVMRNTDFRDRQDARARAFEQCLATDGAFTPAAALATLAMLVADQVRLYCRHWRRQPWLYWEIGALPYRRAVLRGLFGLYRPRYFWGRDDYNVEHILRRQEVHRFGGRSHGVGHAVQGITILMPQLRYISFDTYYTMGRAFHPYYADTWAADMTLRAIGSFGYTRDDLRKPIGTGGEIVFLTRFAVGDPQWRDIFRATAAAFPDRTVLLQVRKDYLADPGVPEFIAACLDGLPNAGHTTDGAYDLVRRAACVLSDASTIIAETIQLGVPIFMVDILGQDSCIYRTLPGLCLSDAGQVTAAVAGVISGDQPYRQDLYGAIIDTSGDVIYDVIRKDMGLAPRQPLTAH